MAKNQAKSVVIATARKGRPPLSDAERAERARKRQMIANINPLAAISDAQKTAYWAIADGKTTAEAAEISGIQLTSLKARMYEPEGKAALALIRQLHRDGFRDKLWQELLAMAGVVPGRPAAERDQDRLKAITEALGMLGDSKEAMVVRGRRDAGTGDDGMGDGDDEMRGLPMMPQLVINITGAGTTADTVTIEQADE